MSPILRSELLCDIRQITGKMKKSETEFRKKFQEITLQISKDMYGTGRSKSDDSDTNLPWTNIVLTTWGAKGRLGPTLENCISTYNSDWSKNQKHFDVDPDRQGIQKIRIAQTGTYEIKSWGAGNFNKTSSGNGFHINIYFNFICTKFFVTN
mgnify:CR=1 FL=1